MAPPAPQFWGEQSDRAWGAIAMGIVVGAALCGRPGIRDNVRGVGRSAGGRVARRDCAGKRTATRGRPDEPPDTGGSSLSFDNDDQLARRLALLHGAMRLDKVFQAEDAVDPGVVPPRRDAVYDLLERGGVAVSRDSLAAVGGELDG